MAKQMEPKSIKNQLKKNKSKIDVEIGRPKIYKDRHSVFLQKQKKDQRL